VSCSVLYLHHYASFGGASRSLLELIRAFPESRVDPHVLAPGGQVLQLFQAERIPVLAARRIALFDNTRVSHYRSLRWLILLRELAALPWAVLALRRARARWPHIELIHVNEITLLPTAIIARWLFKVPLVVHVRAVQSVRPTLRTRAIARLLKRVAARVIAIDLLVRESLPADLPVDVVHNSLALPAARQQISGEPAARPFTVAMVGTLMLAKGCLDFVRAAAICRDRGLNVRFVLVGASARSAKGLAHLVARAIGVSQEIEPALRSFIAANRLEGIVELQGFRMDIDEVYRTIDVVCFPSYFDAPGRPVFEAALFGVPSIAAISDPRADTFVPGETGLSVPPQDPGALADAIESLARDPARCRSLGEQARRLALANCDPERNAQHVLSIYQQVLGRGAS
jgi:glycosyltransferase involved in cell wall biosynthesis